MKTIMIIDDNKNYRVHLKRLLTLEDHATLEAEDGLLGLDAIHKYSPHLILCDMDMPVMDGMEVLRSVKANPKFSMIPFIILSGRNDEQAVTLAQDLGVAAYLVKTIAIKELLATIDDFINKNAQ